MVICSDSSSALDSLQFNHSDRRPAIVFEVQQTLYHIQMMGLIVILWVPVHNGIRGNEMADRMAKKSLKKKSTIELKG